MCDRASIKPPASQWKLKSYLFIVCIWEIRNESYSSATCPIALRIYCYTPVRGYEGAMPCAAVPSRVLQDIEKLQMSSYISRNLEVMI